MHSGSPTTRPLLCLQALVAAGRGVSAQTARPTQSPFESARGPLAEEKQRGRGWAQLCCYSRTLTSPRGARASRALAGIRATCPARVMRRGLARSTGWRNLGAGDEPDSQVECGRARDFGAQLVGARQAARGPGGLCGEAGTLPALHWSMQSLSIRTMSNMISSQT